MEDIKQKLLDAGFRYVSFRPRSRREIVDFLSGKIKQWSVTDAGILDETLEKLARYGHVDDAQLARWWIGQRNVHRPRGVRFLASELLGKGVERQIVDMVLQDEAVASQTDDQTQYQLALKVAQKYQARLSGVPFLQKKQKLFAFLARRGFVSHLVGRVIDELIGKR